MLQLKNLRKSYHVGDSVTHALDDVSISFRNQEFIAILGPSGSGKTTMLNVIGGLDRYDSGDLVINGKSTKNFKETDWDAYRNNSVGFVFQNYNLISHLSIIANVELGMNLSGVPASERRKRAIDALSKVGLKDHIAKNPNQLSGGQMQRVAIARALANNPDILLCDEPTGALDTETSVQIMKLIKELSKDRLVVMVTHNSDLAKEYATRIVNFQDGQVLDDSNPFTPINEKDTFNLKRTKMSYWNAIKLSFTNIMTKKGRTTLTAFASSIGIISIAIVLSLSNGFQKQIDTTMSKALAKYPVTITKTETDLNSIRDRDEADKEKNVKNRGYIIAKQDRLLKSSHENKITREYINYVKKINPKYANNISYQVGANLNLIGNDNGQIKPVQFSPLPAGTAASQAYEQMQSQAASISFMGSSVFPTSLDQSKGNFLKDNYQLLSGTWPKKATDLVMVVDNKNSLNLNVLKNIGIKIKSGEKIDYHKVIGKEFKVVSNNNYYQELPTGMFIPKKPDRAMYGNSKIKLRLVSVIRPKSADSMALLSEGIVYSDKLAVKIINENQNSDIVKAQKKTSRNVMTGQNMNAAVKKQMMQSIGGSSLPAGIMIYSNDFDSKDKVLDYLDKWNKGKKKKDQILYTDMSSAVTSMTGGLLSGITTVLVAFAAISLITSMIMIGILTYTSVLERTKEIGILKALGARKKDITRVFDAETFILGIFSGVLGVVIAQLLVFPINSILYSITNLANVAQLNPLHALILIVISTILTVLGGHLPARMAAKKDAAIALRSE
ncbi:MULTISPECIES: ATP-binding cassette domain-containing protein [unclassified Lactobacillus]|uniref:ABC transporter ATP-binding protein/permease n=1 Tax=unclassified Lactobacillus TaxID=2620435 RepID=UPI002269FD36|nr:MULTISPECIES: ABC transporter ATP-binding protein/permease [unclassified Lactobacillus]MCX8720178.1 ATP-binding cassette domain-containing protein [Lactobacillus sp. B4010]MCX8733347.1 ATP-binding cassette domain-containing protein [Lactobacillus sp. B4015]MCX8735468.1 ATP-binding cassette domain-containing protein [Lactobacillus sp. B4012]